MSLRPNQSPLEVSVSDLDLFRHFREEEGLEVGWLLNKLLVREETEQMRAGSAFHKALETAMEGDHSGVTADGYAFYFREDWELSIPMLREASMNQDYEGLLVKGRVDGIHGKIITELKTTESFDPDRYLEGWQWRFYLDMTGCNRFDWHVFAMSDIGNYEYDVYAYHPLTQYRYQDLHKDCLKATRDYKDFAVRFLAPVLAGAS